MEKLNVNDAIGRTLFHDVTKAADGFKGSLFKRGHKISKEDIPLLLDIGKKTVYVEDESSKDEIHEDDAALHLSLLCKCDGAHFTPISEGKTVLVADRKGYFRVNDVLLREINSIYPITITTLSSDFRAESGARLASMRIIPLSCKKEVIEKAEKLCEGKTLLEYIDYKLKKVGIIITGSEVYEGRIKDKFEPLLREKLSYFPSSIVGVKISDDNKDMIKEAAFDFINKGAELLLFTGGMSVDSDDVTPLAIKELGANIISYGVPAQPGNMTLVGYKESLPILGVPSAAISLPTTLLDVLLPRIFADVEITKDYLVKLGNGGLCQMCKPCHFPNCQFCR